MPRRVTIRDVHVEQRSM